jgi:superfamily II DNA helicase RecQ
VGDNFRQVYQQLSEFRSFFQTPVMALTATSTKKVKADIIRSMHLYRESLKLKKISESVNRSTVYDGFFRFVTVQAYVDTPRFQREY